ncbi:hypothetical protein JCM1841_004718 [Sporobolomyces salmonicolor]
MPDDSEHPPPPLPDYALPPSPLFNPPPSKAEIFELATKTSISDPPPAADDPRVSLRTPLPAPPHLAASPPSTFEEPQTLSEYRAAEGSTQRLSRLRALFDSIPAPSPPSSPVASTSALPDVESPSEAERCAAERKIYTRELWKKCGAAVAASVSPTPGSSPESTASTALEKDRQAALAAVRWQAFEQYAEEKEDELWKVFCELDKDGDMRLKREEVQKACRRAGVEVKDSTLDDFVRAVDRNGDGVISFDEWRDFLLLLPRRASLKEIFLYYQTHRLQRPSMSRLTPDGDVVVGRGKTGWNKLLGKPGVAAANAAKEREKLVEGTNLHKAEERDANDEWRWVQEEKVRKDEEEIGGLAKKAKGKAKEVEKSPASSLETTATVDFEESGVVASDVRSPTRGSAAGAGEAEEEEEEDDATQDMFAGAGKFLLAGGMAGAVSRTATAPFDRLKVYLITSPAEPIKPTTTSSVSKSGKAPRRNAGSLAAAMRAVYSQGGIKAFWTGNMLNVIKIFPESAIKFLSYESAKRVFAQHWDCVPDQTLISNSSRFVAGGIGGVISQFCIYPIESLKTRVMSSTGGAQRGNALILQTARDMWRQGRFRFFFRGLPAGLIGVFPYAAIDMSTFEGIKISYTKWAGEEPGIMGSLAFGAVSGGVGASSVYPLNLVRTRLQAQGTPAHPQTYIGIRDAAMKCYQREGWRGFYKGLTPTLVKVVPAVAISYAVYDTSKKILFATEECHDSDSSEES